MAKMENTFKWGVVNSVDYYTKNEIDSKFKDYYTITETNQQIGILLDTFYSKKEILDLLETKENKLSFIKSTVTATIDENLLISAFNWDNQEIVSLLIFRQRNDNLWFYEHPNNLNVQIIINEGGIWLLAGIKDGWTNNFRFTLTIRGV